MRPMKNLPSLRLFCLLQVVLLFGGSGVQNTVEAGVCSGKQIKACCTHCASLCRPLENRPTLEHRGQLVVSYPSCLKRCHTLCRSSKATFEKKLYVSEHPLSVCVQKWFEQEGCQPFSLGLFFSGSLEDLKAWMANLWIRFKNFLFWGPRPTPPGPLLDGLGTEHKTSVAQPPSEGYVIQIFTPRREGKEEKLPVSSKTQGLVGN